MTLVIADIHLQPNQPDHPINQTFLRFIKEVAVKAEQLFILGDLFEVWLGDDISLDEYPQEIAALSKLSEQGTQIFVQFGNRDFLMRREFEQATGCKILPNKYLTSIFGHKIIMIHGDQLCTDDKQYQKLRFWLRNPISLWILLHLSQNKRRAIGKNLRSESQSSGQIKHEITMDVTESAVQKLFSRHPEYPTLIHGHTHKPAIHQHIVNGRNYTRYVLSDWRPETEYLEISAIGIEVKHFS